LTLKAVRVQTRATARTIQCIERDRGVQSTAEMFVIESKIGRRVREYLMELLLTKPVPLHNNDSVQSLLDTVLLGAIPAAGLASVHAETMPAYYPCRQRGCRLVFSSPPLGSCRHHTCGTSHRPDPRCRSSLRAPTASVRLDIGSLISPTHQYYDFSPH
jgi:hypothetical protein